MASFRRCSISSALTVMPARSRIAVSMGMTGPPSRSSISRLLTERSMQERSSTPALASAQLLTRRRTNRPISPASVTPFKGEDDNHDEDECTSGGSVVKLGLVLLKLVREKGKLGVEEGDEAALFAERLGVRGGESER